MRVFAISDLHLSLGTDKPMDIFGEHWTNHHEKIANSWDELVSDDDIVCMPGDFSWAKNAEQAKKDFDWLNKRAGKKVLIKGNHDYWWQKTKKKMNDILPKNVFAIKKNSLVIDGVLFFGVRGSDFKPLSYDNEKRTAEDIEAELKRELHEFELSIDTFPENHEGLKKVCMFHYPPFHYDGKDNFFTDKIDEADCDICIYGHLHGSSPNKYKGIKNIDFHCVSCDQLDFVLKRIL